MNTTAPWPRLWLATRPGGQRVAFPVRTLAARWAGKRGTVALYRLAERQRTVVVRGFRP